MPRPAVLSREKIAEAALRVIDRDGLAALTMRSLGRELGVAAMSLYNHVADRAGLESLVAEAVVSNIELGDVAADAGVEVRRLMVELRGSLNAHPAAIPLILTRPTASEAALAPIEALLEALARAGFTGSDLLGAYRTLFAFLVGFAQADLAGPVSSGQPATLDEVAAGVLRLPEHAFPRLRACAVAAKTSTSDAEFDYGLTTVLRGLGITSDDFA
ncbi:TetR/AcrR family transcriptional regulator C-terminal domain-containing protein [Pseudonocardia spinosispora]|uniref:TetR/AcrR family transcriptional regulator C-terminal domain-containing protein n=1 Tax=Pseudonocardia spinosispora TaxID=103441 RepID=UPI0004159EA2|nr:TetR/AcrR family transcriptional regulator C-terminal domain-containing protein [Pseudonocardia spinosispora]